MTNPVRNFYFEGHVRTVALPLIQDFDARVLEVGRAPDCMPRYELWLTAALAFANLALAVDEDLSDKHLALSLVPARSGLYSGQLVTVSERRRSGTGLVMVTIEAHPEETSMWPFVGLRLRVSETYIVYAEPSDLPRCASCGERNLAHRGCVVCGSTESVVGRVG